MHDVWHTVPASPTDLLRGPHVSHLSRRSFTALAVAAVAALSACGADSTSSSGGSAPSTAPQGAASGSATETAPNVIIDVRTPKEFAEGHIEGAVNIDLSSETFGESIAALDMSDSYGVYCRSGNRSAQAVTRMKEAGFTDVRDLGGMTDAAQELGREIVTD